MSVELVHSQPSQDTMQRVIRIRADTIRLADAPLPEIRALYAQIERARDALSRILDRADGKDA
jgi:hypothetical protein